MSGKFDTQKLYVKKLYHLCPFSVGKLYSSLVSSQYWVN